MLSRNLVARAITSVGLLVIAFFAIAYVSPAEARFATCASDPILVLSNGRMLAVRVNIKTDVANVQTIAYSVHTPPGVKLLKVVYPWFPGFTGKEQFTFSDDAPPNQYLTDTVVQTSVTNVSVSATSKMSNATQSISGWNAQHLTATLFH